MPMETVFPSGHPQGCRCEVCTQISKKQVGGGMSETANFPLVKVFTKELSPDPQKNIKKKHIEAELNIMKKLVECDRAGLYHARLISTLPKKGPRPDGYVCLMIESVLPYNEWASENAHQRFMKLHFSYELVEAVAWLHDKRVIHRDIKLENLTVRLPNTLLVGDFGLSHDLDTNPLNSEEIVGTPGFAAPEQLSRKYKQEVGELSDAFGCAVSVMAILSTKEYQPSVTEYEKFLDDDKAQFTAMDSVRQHKKTVPQHVWHFLQIELHSITPTKDQVTQAGTQYYPELRMSIKEMLKHKLFSVNNVDEGGQSDSDDVPETVNIKKQDVGASDAVAGSDDDDSFDSQPPPSNQARSQGAIGNSGAAAAGALQDGGKNKQVEKHGTKKKWTVEDWFNIREPNAGGKVMCRKCHNWLGRNKRNLGRHPCYRDA